jgi:hypothetical protein
VAKSDLPQRLDVKSRLILTTVFASVLYLGSYLGLRATHREVWVRDGKDYLIFPRDWPALYYLFRPLTYLDGALTGLQFHIGPHR